MEIDQILDNIFCMPDPSRLALKNCITEVSFPKGQVLIKANRIEKHIYFLKKGIARAYANSAGNEITFWFGDEGQGVISMRSYVDNKKGYEDVQLLEDSDLYKLDLADLRALFEVNIDIANWGRKFVEQELIKVEERLISRQFKTARERYLDLLKDHPNLLQRVQLGHIASYLGITQVSLSRIRADIR